jgi:hypothetical protein
MIKLEFTLILALGIFVTLMCLKSLYDFSILVDQLEDAVIENEKILLDIECSKQTLLKAGCVDE